MADILVRTAQPYTVSIEANIEALCRKIAGVLRGRKIALVSDANVAPLYAEEIAAFLAEREVLEIVVPAGEESKSPAQYLFILNQMAAHDFTRDDAVIALGGGVVGDLAAFAASTYMRGVRLVAIPTSLLAMVDSSVGGKTAINIDYGKNLCGTFYQPNAVFMQTKYLDTLPRREILCGWGEIIKYAFLADSVTEEDLRGEATPALIAKCVQIKADIVTADEKESGLRKLLNLGHTVGHAVERLSDFTLSHGECVAKGLMAIADVSARYYGWRDDVYARARAMIAAKGHDLSIAYPKDAILREIAKDKKCHADGVDLVLINAALHAEIVRISYDVLGDLLP